jgi:hypothetical protein
LPVPAGTEREDHVVAGERFHVDGLGRRSRDNRLLARPDHHLRRRGDLVGDDSVEARLSRHSDHRFDSFGVDVVALLEPVVEPDENVPGTRRGIGLALDLHPVAARGDSHSEPALDGDEVAVIIAEQRAEQIGLFELQLEPCASRNCTA